MQDWLIKRGSAKLPSPGGDRGIIIPAGGVDQLANAFVNAHVLRHHLGCTLPITIAYWGALTKEAIDQDTMNYFHQNLAQVTFMDLSKASYPAHQRWLFPPIPDGSFVGFKVKVYAVYAAPYKEVLVIDSDSMPLMDPEPFFDLPEYRKTGNAFWPDRWCTPVKLFHKLGMEDGEGDRYQADSGQFLFDRNRHSNVLEWLLFLNTHNEFTYRFAHGDKDTYRAAFELAEKGDEYYQVDQPMSVALQPGLFGATARGFVQHHPNGSVAFVHRTSEAKYKAHSASGRAFSRLLLQPSCHWNQRHWHFFSPSVGTTKTGAWKESKCQFTLWDPEASKAVCGQKLKKEGQPPILEVSRNSFVGQAQAAADSAMVLFKAHVQSRPDLYPTKPGSKTMGTLLIIFSIGAGVWAALRVVAVLRQRRQVSWSVLPSTAP